MPEPISIGAIAYFDMLRQKLNGEVGKLQSDGWQVSLAESQVGDIRFVDCTLEDPARYLYPSEILEYDLRRQVATVVSDLIVNRWEQDLLQEIIMGEYYYFGEEERRVILDYACRHLNQTLSGLEDQATSRLTRQVIIIHKLLDYLAVHSQLVVDGFIRFRLKEYVSQLEECVERAVDDFIMEREYREFVNLLKYFVEIQEPRIDEVHVTCSPEGRFNLWNKEKKIIENNGLEAFAEDEAFQDINYEDLLVSALITLAPGQIVLHLPRDGRFHNTINTLNNVFTERVTLCPGCEWCGVVH
ncbi:MAG TPA: putative sporulation protein YtxC [Bacillota bacterium]|nr:putative sporulation protein YtxC [Bacillota bacterium]